MLRARASSLVSWSALSDMCHMTNILMWPGAAKAARLTQEIDAAGTRETLFCEDNPTTIERLCFARATLQLTTPLVWQGAAKAARLTQEMDVAHLLGAGVISCYQLGG